MSAIKDILEWSSTKLSPWKQDALRRLACQSALTNVDHDELLSHIKQAVGFVIPIAPPALIPLDPTHVSSTTADISTHIKTIRNVENVNRLVPAANLTFAPKGLTVIYGRNGSGKSGFVRIFRTACRTRIEKPEKLKVLVDVYGSGKGPQQAEIVIDRAGIEQIVTWTSGAGAHPELLHIAVFDSSAAQLYVDNGSNIQFLPFGLALPHKLNELCLELKVKLDNERRPISAALVTAVVNFSQLRSTDSQKFYSQISAKSTNEQIDKASTFSETDQQKLDSLTRVLTGASAAAADLHALSIWMRKIASECNSLTDFLNDTKLEEATAKKAAAVEARKLAGLDSSKLFQGEPLPGIGSESWRKLWEAAREFSTTDAYADQPFPVTSMEGKDAACVLCLRPLNSDASGRLNRFEAFVSGKIAVDAKEAEERVQSLLEARPALGGLADTDWNARLDQISKREPEVAQALSTFKAAIEGRLRGLSTLLNRGVIEEVLQPLQSPGKSLENLAGGIAKDADAARAAQDETARAALMAEHAELEDRKILSANNGMLKSRRDLLKQDGLYNDALSEVATTAITKRANELVDLHLTQLVYDQYEAERKALEITHLKVNLARKSGKVNATFQTDPGTAMTKFASEILSEGEQRALALAAFFTEVAVTDGFGSIVIDDPVSSLDRQRGQKVAARLSAEAKTRQVIVFTHDLVFLNDLCREAGALDVNIETTALFADGANAGKIDPGGVLWKGLNVDRRLKLIKTEALPIKKLIETSPAAYEYQIKNLYGRLRDTYERAVEEIIFYDIVQRYSDRIETLKLRYIYLSDELAVRFHEGMTKANTHSHDNPAAQTVHAPLPDEFDADVAAFEHLIADLKAEQRVAETNRPTMKPKKP